MTDNSSTQSLSTVLGPCLTSVILLHDWAKYGLSERVCFHFDLTEALAYTSRPDRVNPCNLQEADDKESRCPTCGVFRIIECIPTAHLKNLSKWQRRSVKKSMQRFNSEAERITNERRLYCYEPPALPIRFNPETRVFFAYETTRITFCIDASPTLTSTFGFANSTYSVRTDYGKSACCCPLDQLVQMARDYFTALVKPISTPTSGVWTPSVAVSVIAVFPTRSSEPPDISVLVRDFHMVDLEAAEKLSRNLRQWVLGPVEAQIARRMNDRDTGGFADAWAMPSPTSMLKDIIFAGDATLSTMSSAARPCLSIATDCCSVECGGILDVLANQDIEDVPISILDLSSPQAHEAPGSAKDVFGLRHMDILKGDFMPLYLSDDSAALHRVCQATGGVFWDAKLLEEAGKVNAGSIPATSTFNSDSYFSFGRHSVKPNAVQWYTLLSLSPLSPRPNPSWGTAPAPDYLQEKGSSPRQLEQQDITGRPRSPRTLSLRSTIQSTSGSLPPIRAFLSSYVINPIPIHGLLMLRVKRGFRAKQYGQSTLDPTKVSIQLTLPVDLGIVLHYELSYKALPGKDHRVGFANIRIEISGEPTLIQMIKAAFGRDHTEQQSWVFPRLRAVAYQLCTFLQGLRPEDTRHSILSPMKWRDQLKSAETPFVHRLFALNSIQERQHFRLFEFDCVCTGKMPYDHDDPDVLSQFRDIDDGSSELIHAVADWADLTLRQDGTLFVKRVPNSDDSLPSYSVIVLQRFSQSSRLWTIAVSSLGGGRSSERLWLINSLRTSLQGLQQVQVLPAQMSRYLVGMKHHQNVRSSILERQNDHATWDLVTDPELITLLMRRRVLVGKFLLLESTDEYAQFGWLQTEPDHVSKSGTLVQYQLTMGRDKAVVDVYMESQSGEFQNHRQCSQTVRTSRFHKIVQLTQNTDQECGLALQCRTSLLSMFGDDHIRPEPIWQLACVRKLLEYASKTTLQLRGFSQVSTGANERLRLLTEQMMLGHRFGRVEVARLDLGESIVTMDLGAGVWFVVKYDKSTTSIIHLGQFGSNWEIEEGKTSHATLTVFTVGVGDVCTILC